MWGVVDVGEGQHRESLVLHWGTVVSGFAHECNMCAVVSLTSCDKFR